MESGLEQENAYGSRDLKPNVRFSALKVSGTDVNILSRFVGIYSLLCIISTNLKGLSEH